MRNIVQRSGTPEYFAAFAAKFQNAPEHFTTRCMEELNIN